MVTVGLLEDHIEVGDAFPLRQGRLLRRFSRVLSGGNSIVIGFFRLQVGLVGRIILCLCAPVASFLQEGPHIPDHIGGDAAILPDPQDHRIVLAAAGSAGPGSHIRIGGIGQIGLPGLEGIVAAYIRRNIGAAALLGSIGLEVVDLRQPVLFLLELELQLLHLQPLLFQSQFRQSGVVGHEHVILLDRIPNLHVDLRDGLRV